MIIKLVFENELVDQWAEKSSHRAILMTHLQ